jgi:hypothetical protein
MTFITMAETPWRPWTVAIQDVRAWLQQGEIRCSQVRLPAYLLQVEEDISDAEKAIRDRSWLRIAGLVSAEVAGELFSGACDGFASSGTCQSDGDAAQNPLRR